MSKIINTEIELPYICEECKNFIGGLKCKAFDRVPRDIHYNAEIHTQVVPGQIGDYIFIAKGPRGIRHIYCGPDEED